METVFWCLLKQSNNLDQFWKETSQIKPGLPFPSYSQRMWFHPIHPLLTYQPLPRPSLSKDIHVRFVAADLSNFLSPVLSEWGWEKSCTVMNCQSAILSIRGNLAKQTPWLAFPKHSKMWCFVVFFFFLLATSLAWVPTFCRNWVDLLHGLFCITGPNPEKIVPFIFGPCLGKILAEVSAANLFQL